MLQLEPCGVLEENPLNVGWSAQTLGKTHVFKKGDYIAKFYPATRTTHVWKGSALLAVESTRENLDSLTLENFIKNLDKIINTFKIN